MEESEFTKVRVLKYIAEHEPVAVTRMKEDLKISIGSIYHHLNTLSGVLEQDHQKRYSMNNEGKLLLAKHNNNYESVLKEIISIPTPLKFKPVGLADEAMMQEPSAEAILRVDASQLHTYSLTRRGSKMAMRQ